MAKVVEPKSYKITSNPLNPNAKSLWKITRRIEPPTINLLNVYDLR